jgi:hypothetical protein
MRGSMGFAENHQAWPRLAQLFWNLWSCPHCSTDNVYNVYSVISSFFPRALPSRVQVQILRSEAITSKPPHLGSTAAAPYNLLHLLQRNKPNILDLSNPNAFKCSLITTCLAGSAANARFAASSEQSEVCSAVDGSGILWATS